MERNQTELCLEFCMYLLGTFTCPPHQSGEAHSHPFWELLLYNRDGAKASAEPQFRVFAPDETHCFHNDGATDCRILYIGFSFSDRHADAETLKAAITERLFAAQKTLSGVYRACLSATALEAQSGAVLSFLCSILPFPDAPSAPESTLADKIKKCIRNHPDHFYTVEELAASLYFSPKYLGEVFRRETGLSVLAYQQQVKLEQALSMLTQEQLSVSTVARKLGYRNVSYFSLTFKRQFGVSPSQISAQYDAFRRKNV